MRWLRENLPYFQDVVEKDNKTAINADLSVIGEESGLDRVKRIFQTDEFEEISPEANLIMQSGCLSMFVGAIYGGVIYSRAAYMNFIQTNEATAFKSHLDAKRKLQDEVTRGFAKGAFKWGWRLTMFSMSYTGISTLISVYRDKGGIMEHVVAGSATGFLYKFTAGPRAWIVGGTLGMVLGTLAGCCSYGLLSLSGMSMKDVRYWNYQWREMRYKQHRQYLEKEGMEEELQAYSEMMEQKGRHGVDLESIPLK